MDAFNVAWNVVKARTDEKNWSDRYYGLSAGEHGPPEKPMDAGKYRSSKEGKEFETMSNDHEWVFSPHRGKRVQVDRLMKPLLESMWARGIDTTFSDTGGDEDHRSLHGLRGRDEGYISGIRDVSDKLPEELMRLPVQQGAMTGDNWINRLKVDGRFRDNEAEYSELPLESDNVIRWPSSHDLKYLREIYDLFDVPFPEHHMEGGKIKWRGQGQGQFRRSTVAHEQWEREIDND